MTQPNRAGALGELTNEQRIAAGTSMRNVFINAGPGSGKTTVSAHRFGVLRFLVNNRGDDRAVVAVSFTRAATRTLSQRIQRLYGPSATRWPHRIITLDTLLADLLHYLLRSRVIFWPHQNILWPNGDIQLDIHDSWSAFSGTSWNRTTYEVGMVGHNVTFESGFSTSPSSRVPSTVIMARLAQGICTHDDVRAILAEVMKREDCRDRIIERLRHTMRALVIDEVFDANLLDVELIDAVLESGLNVTLVGDPWQALYLFRGARPQAVLELITAKSIPTLDLRRSFRWQTQKQEHLAERLRAGMSVALPALATSVSNAKLDVVLALTWNDLWSAGNDVLPLAYGAFKGGHEEAAATLLLNHVLRSIFAMDGTYVGDSLTALGIAERTILQELEPRFDQIVSTLRSAGEESVRQSYLELRDTIHSVSPRRLREPHYRHTDRLKLLQSRLQHSGVLVPGLTTHQSKGGEWDSVGVVLSPSEREALSRGLSQDNDTHRKLYVACTRARYRTLDATPV